jgi:hypothetical protein
MAYKINPFTGELDRVLGPGNGTASIEFTTDAGTANPTVAGVITIAGGTGINTAGAGSTVTINLDVPVIVANGGTGSPLTDGQLLIGDTAGVSPAAATLTAGAGIGIVNAAGSITISSTAGGFAWTEVTGTTQAMAIESGYIANNAGLVTLTLPAVAVIGEAVQIVGKGAGLYAIAQNAGQTIHYIASDTTTGVGGSLTAIEQYASIELVCITANTEWVVVDSVGNFTIV